MLKNLLQNQQNLKARGIYSCTGIYFFKSANDSEKCRNSTVLIGLCLTMSDERMIWLTIMGKGSGRLTSFAESIVYNEPTQTERG